MESRNLTCIGCPMGCLMTVEMENGEVVSVTGNTCKRGDDYASLSNVILKRNIADFVCTDFCNRMFFNLANTFS